MQGLPALTRAVVAVVFATLVVGAGSAQAVVGSADVTRGVVGYGTVSVTSGSGVADCVSPASYPGGDSAYEFDCASFADTSADACAAGTDGGSACQVTLSASPGDSAGWRFDHWSGDCAGTQVTCTLPTSETDCDPTVKPPCHTTVFGPYTAVAHFVDTRAPTTTLNQAPAANSIVYSDTRSQQFTFATDESNEAPTFQCRRDPGTFTGCSSGVTWSSIADGIHDFCVHATDASGLQGGDACRHWEQETNPTALISTHPAATSASATPSFTYTSNKAGHPADGSTLSYACKLDGGTFSACPASGRSYNGLADGSHTFQVEAVFHGALEAAGFSHTSAPASFTWTQDTAGPVITLQSSPDETVNLTATRSATVAWTGSEPSGETFACHLDDAPGALTPCSSPLTLTDLADGIHDLQIQATDGLGNVGPVAHVHWEQEVPPAATITAGPADGETLSTRHTSFSFSSNKSGATFACSVDGGAFVACTSPDVFDVAADGAHTFAVRTSFTSSLFAHTYTSSAVSRSWHVATQTAGPPAPGATPGPTTKPSHRPRINARFAVAWKLVGRYTVLRSLSVVAARGQRLPAGATITLSCSASRRACPLRGEAWRVRRSVATIAVRSALAHAQLPAGAVIEVRLTKAGMVGLDETFTLRSARNPTVRVRTA